MTVKYDEMTSYVTIVHPALAALGPHFFQQLMLGDQRMDYSLEFAYFMTEWANGRRKQEPFDIRNWDIARRKALYSQFLLTEDGVFTEVGKWIHSDCKLMLQQIGRYHRQNMTDFPKLEDPTSYANLDKLDELFLMAIFTPRERKILRAMYTEHLKYRAQTETLESDELDELEKQRQSATYPGDRLDTFFVRHPKTGYGYLDTSKFRKAPVARRSTEMLLKLSMIDYVNLSRRELGLSPHGRPLKGAKIAPCGIRFMELYMRDKSAKWQMSDMSNSVVVRQDQFDRPGRSTQPAHSASSKSGITEPARTPHPRSFEPFPSAEQVAARYVDDPATTFITNHDDTTRMFDGTTITFNPNGVVKHATFGKYADYVNDLIKQDVVMGWNDLEPVLLEMQEEKS